MHMLVQLFLKAVQLLLHAGNATRAKEMEEYDKANIPVQFCFSHPGLFFISWLFAFWAFGLSMLVDP